LRQQVSGFILFPASPPDLREREIEIERERVCVCEEKEKNSSPRKKRKKKKGPKEINTIGRLQPKEERVTLDDLIREEREREKNEENTTGGGAHVVAPYMFRRTR
jgi:hypothetical protein